MWINLTGEINPKQMLERQKNAAAFYSKQANGLSNRSSQTLCRWFACEPILHHRETLCVFILLGAFWAKEHITSSLCFIVFSKLINGKHSGKNRYENVYFALLKSLSTKGYQQLLWHNLWNVIRVCVWESSADKAASAITDSPPHNISLCPLETYSLWTNSAWHMHFCFSYHGATCELKWVCGTGNFQITFRTSRVSDLPWFIHSRRRKPTTLIIAGIPGVLCMFGETDAKFAMKECWSPVITSKNNT